MKAIFKNNTKLIINSADSSEELLLDTFIENAKSSAYTINFTTLYDINGDTDGVAIELVKVPENTETTSDTEPAE